MSSNRKGKECPPPPLSALLINVENSKRLSIIYISLFSVLIIFVPHDFSPMRNWTSSYITHLLAFYTSLNTAYEAFYFYIIVQLIPDEISQRIIPRLLFSRRWKNTVCGFKTFHIYLRQPLARSCPHLSLLRSCASVKDQNYNQS